MAIITTLTLTPIIAKIPERRSTFFFGDTYLHYACDYLSINQDLRAAYLYAFSYLFLVFSQDHLSYEASFCVTAGRFEESLDLFARITDGLD